MKSKDIPGEQREGVEIAVSFVNMPPQEELVMTVRRAAAMHAFRRIASRVERVATGLYRARVSADGRGGHFAHRNAQLALLGALARLLLDPAA